MSKTFIMNDRQHATIPQSWFRLHPTCRIDPPYWLAVVAELIARGHTDYENAPRGSVMAAIRKISAEEPWASDERECEP